MADTSHASSSPPRKPKPRYPFQDLDADIIIRSPDGAEFKTHKFYLSKASVAFRNMFALPNSENTIQTIDVEEDAATIDLILTWCDPRGLPGLKTPPFTTFYNALNAAGKYQMDSASLHTLQNYACEPYISASPLRVYALACQSLRFNAEISTSVARIAAVRLLGEIPPFSLTDYGFPEVATLSGKELFTLYNFHSACGKAASAYTSHLTWCKNSVKKMITQGASGLYQFMFLQEFSFSSSSPMEIIGNFHCPKWWLDYLAELGKTLLTTPTCRLFPSAITMVKGFLPSTNHSSQTWTKFYPNLCEFIVALQASVDQAIANVPLKLDG